MLEFPDITLLCCFVCYYELALVLMPTAFVVNECCLRCQAGRVVIPAAPFRTTRCCSGMHRARAFKRVDYHHSLIGSRSVGDDVSLLVRITIILRIGIGIRVFIWVVMKREQRWQRLALFVISQSERNLKLLGIE